ncbi:MAG: phage tail sheath subtilisin-like domain-containing protein [Bacteroidia bacterium]|nr:phage tail sheath subtilisin-like domain-containing protein [Bacteroidia bacterium]
MASTANNPTVPGVYIQEIPKFPPSVAAVSTAIPAFIGYTEKAQRFIKDDLFLKPTRITSLLEYTTFFGGPQLETGIQVTIAQEGAPDPDDATRFIVSKEMVSVALPAAGASKHNMYYALQSYFANGGGPCFIVAVGDATAADKAVYKTVAGALVQSELLAGLTALESEDEPTLIVFPEGQNVSNASAMQALQEAALAQCSKLQDRFAIMDVYPNVVPADAISTFRNLTGDLKYGAVYYPNLVSVFSYAYDPAQTVLTHTQNGATATLGSVNGAMMDSLEGTNGALYAKIKAAITDFGVTLPPSPAIAGVYARVDSNRGVWKAPANVGVNGIKGGDKGLSLKITDDFQDGMNVDPTAGKSVNAIRFFTGKGTLVWGARTLAGNDNEWRYVSVRRFFNMVEESVKKATYQFVFEPNDANTWVKVRAMIENFLILQWRAGALAGAKPEQAFYVKVGLGETMTSIDVLEGKMNVEIGMAVVRPAEFIILKFSHKMQEA